jgi:hypothetical protein
MTIDFGDANPAVGLPLAVAAIEDLLLIHGCPSEKVAEFLRDLQGWLRGKPLRSLALYGSEDTLRVTLWGRGGRRMSRQFKGEGCSLRPAGAG